MARVQRLPPVHALAAFESAARLGGFAQAAAELCITPSAVSHRIRLLEAHINQNLFERSSTGVRLSDAGQRYLLGVREAFEKLARLVPADEPEVVRLSVGSPPTFARNMLMPRLPDFYRQWPEIEIEVAVAAPMQDKPDRHHVDIRFGRGPFDERVATKLFDDRVQALAAPHYLQGRAITTPADLAHAELLRSPLVPWRPWFAAAGLAWPEPARGATFMDLGILLEAAASGLGVAVCPLRIADHWLRGRQLIPVFDIAVAAESTYYALVERDLVQRPEIAAFVEWLGVTFA